MTIHCMIDLETMGVRSNAAILAIGAHAFHLDPGTDDRIEAAGPRQFYRVIRLESAMTAGLSLDASTVTWWMGQSREAQQAWVSKQKSGGSAIQLAVALRDFYEYVQRLKSVHADVVFWGNGADFDIPILRNAYQVSDVIDPMGPFSARCYRTMENLYKHIPFQKPHLAHNALEDAEVQARHLMEILKHVGNYLPSEYD